MARQSARDLAHARAPIFELVRFAFGTALCVLAPLACAAAPAEGARPAQPARTVEVLSARLEQLARPSQAKIGVAYRVLETGQSYQLRGNAAFPLASVYKFPIALAVLAGVDAQRLTLGQELQLTKQDLSVGRSPIAEHFSEPGQKFTVRDLLSAMIVDSDNTACDVLLKTLGGARVVMAYLEQLGVRGMRVDRTEIAIEADGINAARPGSLESLELFDKASVERLAVSLTPAEQEAMKAAYMADPRDTGTPGALVELLTRFQFGKVLSSESTALLTELMQRARPLRLALRLPANTSSFHKTGTGWGSANDVGVVTLPNGHHLALAVMLTKARGLSLEDYDALIADAGRLVYDSAIASDASKRSSASRAP